MSLDLEKGTDRRISRAGLEGAPPPNDAFSARLDEQLSRQASPPECEEPNWPTTWKAYASLAGCFFLMFNSWGVVNAYGTFLSYYQEALLSDQGIIQFNLIGSTQCFVVLFFSVFVGRLLDANYSRLLIIIGTCFATVSMFMLSVVNGSGGPGQGSYSLTWLLQGPLMGLGMACFFVTSSQVAATWFIKRKSFAIGIVASGASISGLVYPIMLRFLIRSHGFNFAVRMVATLLLITCVTAILLARPNPQHAHRKPEKWLAVATWIDTGALRQPTFLWFTTAICFLFFGFYAVFFNLEEWAAQENIGISGDPMPGERGLQTYYLLAIMNATSTIGRIGSAYLCGHFNPLKVHCTVTMIASLLCFFLWSLAGTLKLALVFVVLFGAFSGSVIGLPPASMASILHGSPEKLGQWTGMMYTTAAPFALTGPVIAGHLISKFGYNFITVQCWAGASLALSAACMGMAVWCDAQIRKEDDQEKMLGGAGSESPRSRLNSVVSVMSFWSRKEEA